MTGLRYPVWSLVICLGLCVRSGAQPLTQAQIDSGWVSLFNGKDLSGFYASFDGNQGTPLNSKAADAFGIFSIQNGIIHCTGSNWGYLATVGKYSHYRFRVDFKYPKNGDSAQNSGVIYHVVENAPRLNGTWPRSIECQGQKRGVGELWTISDVWITTQVENPNSSPRRYKEGGQKVEHGNPQGRQCLGSANPYKDGEWNTLEIEVRGGDSAIHKSNGQVVFKAWKLRTAADNQPADFSHPLMGGSIGLQSEKAEILYRNVDIMELDSGTGQPIHAKPTSASSIPNHGSHGSLRAGLDRGWLMPWVSPQTGFDNVLDLRGRYITRIPSY